LFHPATYFGSTSNGSLNNQYLAAGGSCAAFLACFGMGWQKIEKLPGKK
jgi:hypothetical protein